MRKTVRIGAAIVAAMVGSLALTGGCAHPGVKEGDKVIAMNDLPAAVRPLAENEVKGCKIIEVEREVKRGNVIYAITYDQAGTKMEVEYSADGTLLSKGKE